jgi:hypothetical protein
VVMNAAPYADNTDCLYQPIPEKPTTAPLTVKQACVGCVKDGNFEPRSMEWPDKIKEQK